jgi:hypothetical protein
MSKDYVSIWRLLNALARRAGKIDYVGAIWINSITNRCYLCDGLFPTSDLSRIDILYEHAMIHIKEHNLTALL